MIGESYLWRPDGKHIPLSSMTPEEKQSMADGISRNIVNALPGWWERFPNDRKHIARSILKSGNTLYKRTSEEVMLWKEEMIDGKIYHTDYQNGIPCEPVVVDEPMPHILT